MERELNTRMRQELNKLFHRWRITYGCRMIDLGHTAEMEKRPMGVYTILLRDQRVIDDPNANIKDNLLEEKVDELKAELDMVLEKLDEIGPQGFGGSQSMNITQDEVALFFCWMD